MDGNGGDFQAFPISKDLGTIIQLNQPFINGCLGFQGAMCVFLAQSSEERYR